MVLGSTGRSALVITMAGGERMDAINLEERVLAYWQRELALDRAEGSPERAQV
jgi:hypothetical protein